MQAVAYLQTLDLRSNVTYLDSRTTLGVAKPELPKLSDKEQAFFSEKTILSFASEVPEESRKDILNSTLLAQMAANFKVPEGEDPMQWYKAFIDVLEKTGWFIEGKDIQSFTSRSNLFEVETVVIDILTTAFGAGYITVIKKTLEGIKKLSSSDRKIKAFEKNTTKVTKGSFQIALVTAKSGVVFLKIGTFILSSTHDITTILFFRSDKQATELDYISKTATLNKNIYQVIRESVKEKLGNYVRTNIAEIKLA